MILDKEKNFISAIVYIRNDKGYIREFMQMMIETLDKHFEHSEIICVNDNSSDGSLREIQEIKDELVDAVELSVINLSYYHGLETAMNVGSELSIGDFIFEFDSVYADYNPQVITDVYKKLLTGFDIVKAIPNRKQRLSSSIFYELYKRYSENHDELRTDSFHIISRRAYNRISSMTKKVLYRKALYANCGLKVWDMEYEVIPDYRKKHVSGLQRRYRSNLALDSLLLFTNIGYAISKAITTAMMLFIIGVVIYALVIRFKGIPIEGWTSTLMFLSVAFFGVFLVFTIILKYLQLILSIVFNNRSFNYESIEKVKNIRS